MDRNHDDYKPAATSASLPVDESLIAEGDKVLAAVSGGADSMALLSILHKLSSQIGFELAVGHFDHRLREASSVEKRRVEVMASNLGVPFYCGEGDVRSRAKARGETVEEAARKLRYRYLFKLAGDIGADLIATGHTRDDQIETILMRILRGTGVRGLAGIQVKRGKLIRPILGMSHRQAVTYCQINHIAHVEDPSNRDRRFTRNWIRYELLPVLKNNFPNVGENLLRLSRNSKGALRRVQKITTPLISQYLTREPNGDWTLDLREIAGLDHNSKYVLFGDLLTENLGCDPDFSREHFEKLAHISGAAAVSGQMLSLPGLTVRREYDTLVFSSTSDTTSDVPPLQDIAALPIPGRAEFGNLAVLSVVMQATEYKTEKYRSTEPSLFEANGNRLQGEAYFALEAIDPPLSIRLSQPGDRMRPFGTQGHKKLSDIFSDKKIPLRRRGKTVVISDQKEILWLVGVTTSESTRVSADSKNILKISVIPE
jgi:tRNA(Ile)-lysidine synthase